MDRKGPQGKVTLLSTCPQGPSRLVPGTTGAPRGCCGQHSRSQGADCKGGNALARLTAGSATLTSCLGSPLAVGGMAQVAPILGNADYFHSWWHTFQNILAQCAAPPIQKGVYSPTRDPGCSVTIVTKEDTIGSCLRPGPQTPSRSRLCLCDAA